MRPVSLEFHMTISIDIDEGFAEVYMETLANKLGMQSTLR